MIKYASIRTFTLTLLYAFTPTLYLLRNYVSVHRITGDSMSPTLSPNYTEFQRADYVLFRRGLRLWECAEHNEKPEGRSPSPLRRGTIVSFWAPHDPEKVAVKRIVAVAGDRVAPLPKRLGGHPDRMMSGGGSRREEVVVPYGHVWVEGDNELDSWDSNDYGAISVGLVTGIASRIVGPKGRRGRVDWEEDGWQRRVAHRMKWNDTTLGNVGVPEEWNMQ